MDYYARKSQSLSEHLINTANFAKKFASAFSSENTAYCAGLLHDMGKFTFAFQDYLKRSLNGQDVKRGEVIHAFQGAKLAAETIKNPIISDMVSNIIATHHGGLFDNITDFSRTLSLKIQKHNDRLHYDEALQAFSANFNEKWLNGGTLEKDLNNEVLNFCRESQKKQLSPCFMLHLLVKAIYSCLVDADRCDAAGITPNDSSPDWLCLISRLETYLSGFTNKTSLEKIRKSISEQCRRGGSRQPGIYTLSVPTGGGKTLSSLRFALEHARRHGQKRIIYVIPYLSILDQTAARIREIFEDNDELILEHHSNVELPEHSDDEDEQYRLLTSRWDSPIILTTMVQFLETVYSNKASKLRKFHNMSETVLIFDEIQALPIKCVHLFNQAVNFLQTFGKSTILLCTATQPHLHKTQRPVLLSTNPDIVKITPEEFKIFERVNIEDRTHPAMNHEQIAALAKAQIEQNKSTLIILNTKGDARKVYEQCKSFECAKAFLTTDLCPAHRLSILEKLRKNLSPENRHLTVCVSTQLIEAGVDISFDCVIRAKAGMDSIVQAAGRCNRNKENSKPQSVIVISVEGENLSRLSEINDGKIVTARVFRENQDKNLLSSEVMDMFYHYHFYAQQDKMDYNIRDGTATIYSLLNDNLLGTSAYKSHNGEEYTGLPCAFQTAADAFSVIDGGQTGLVVPYGDSLQLVADFQRSYDPKEKIRILKKLQKFTVSVYSHTLSKLGGAIRAVDNTFYLLTQDYYDIEEQGLLLEAKFSFMYVQNKR